MVLKVLMEELKALPDHKEFLAPQVILMAPQATQELMVHKGQVVFKVLKVLQAQLEALVLLELMVLQDKVLCHFKLC